MVAPGALYWQRALPRPMLALAIAAAIVYGRIYGLGSDNFEGVGDVVGKFPIIEFGIVVVLVSWRPPKLTASELKW